MKYFLSFLIVVSLNATALAAQGKSVSYTLNGVPYEGYYVSAGTDAPLVVLIHDWDGLTDYEIKRSGMLAEMGYSVFALDLFGKNVRPKTVEKRRELTGALYADRKKMRMLMNGALEFAGRLGANTGNAVAMGYCFGGSAVLEWARSGAAFKGFTAFHGGLATLDGQDYAHAAGSYLILHGSADKAVSLDDFANLAKELEAAGLEHEMITYSGARHAFSVIGGDRYNEKADKKSWARFAGYLEDTLKN